MDAVAAHFGAEVLARAVGAFREGYVYEEYAPESRAVGQAVDAAITAITRPRESVLRMESSPRSC